MDKRKFILVLIFISIVLLLLNIIIDKFQKSEPEKTAYEATVQQVDSLLAIVFDEYGFQNEWINKIAVNNKDYKPLNYIFQIYVPREIPIPIFLADLQQKFNSKYFSLDINEIQFNGKTEIKIFSNNKLKFLGYFNPDSKTQRVGSSFVFILEDGNALSESDFNILDKINIPISILLYPSEESAEIITEIEKHNNLGYSIILNDQISGIKYSLSESLSRERIKGSIHSITTDFSSANIFLYNPHTAPATSIGFSFIKNEFLKRGIELTTKNVFTDYCNLEQKELLSMFKFLHESNQNKEPVKILISINNLELLGSKINSYKKKGDKFLPLKSVL